MFSAPWRAVSCTSSSASIGDVGRGIVDNELYAAVVVVGELGLLFIGCLYGYSRLKR